MEPQETGNSDASSGSLDDRLVSKQWKIRSDAMKELTQLISNDPSQSSFYGPQYIKFVGDANPNVQEAALEGLNTLIARSPAATKQNASDLILALIEKPLTSMKAAVKAQGIESVLAIYQLFKPNELATLNENLLPPLKAKNVKMQQAAANLITVLISNFGIRHIPLKVVMTPVSALLGSSNGQVRYAVMEFYVEVYKWVGQAAIPTDKLKKSQLDELEKMYAEVERNPTPLRYLKGEAPAICPGAEESKGEDAQPVEEAEPDLFDIVEPKDIFSTFDDNWCEGVLAKTKFMEKKQALEQFNAEANTPRLANKSTYSLCNMLKILVNDNNIMVQQQAIKALGLLANGLRREFREQAKLFHSNVFLKFKDKKTQTVAETNTALDSFLLAMGLEDMVDTIRECLNDKTPSVKIQTALFVERAVPKTNPKVLNRIGGDLVQSLKKNINDGNAEVRDSNLCTLGVIKALCGSVAGLFNDIPAAKMGKVEEGVQKAGGMKAAPTLPEPESIVEEVKKPPQRQNSAPRKTAAPARPKTAAAAPAKPRAAAPASPQKKKPTAAAPRAAAAAEEDIGMPLTPDQAEQQMTELLPGSILTQLGATAWKEKQEALQNIGEWIKQNNETASEKSEAIIRHIASKLKDWKENNMNVIKSAFEVIQLIANTCNLLKRSATIVLTTQALDKLSDMKVAASYYDCINALCEVCGPKFVIGQITKNTASVTKPKVLTESCNTIIKLINEFGAHCINVRDSIDYAKMCIGNSNAQIRTAAQNLIIAIYGQVGEAILPLLSDIKEATLKQLHAEFENVTPVQKTEFKQVKNADPEEAKVDLMDELMPRASIAHISTAKLFKKLEDGNWKIRKEGLEAIDEALASANNRILPQGLGDIMKAVGQKISDPNKSIARGFIDLAGRMAEALGPECRSYGRKVLPNLMQSLGDKQNILRQAVVSSIQKWTEQGCDELIMSLSPTYLAIDNFELRTELLTWVIEHKNKVSQVDPITMFKPLISCLQDKKPTIRTMAEDVFSEVYPKIPAQQMEILMKDIKPAAVKQLRPIFDKFRTAGPGPQEEAAPAQSAPAKPTRKTTAAPAANPVSKPAVAKAAPAKPAAPAKSRLQRPATAAARPTAKAAEPVATAGAIGNIGNKDKRLELARRERWSCEELRPDYVEKTTEAWRAIASVEMHDKMFASDFKKNCLAITEFSNLLKNEPDNIIGLLDLIAKWIFMKMWDTSNTQTTKMLIEFSSNLVNYAISIGYLFHELEATIFCTIFCERSGHNNATFRTQIHSLINNSCKIYPPAKLAQVLIKVILASKNLRSKAECLDELANIMAEHGINIVVPKDIISMAPFVGHADTNIRNSSVKLYTEIYKYIGEVKIWNMIGKKIEAKAKDILMQRFRKTEMYPKPEVEEVKEEETPELPPLVKVSKSTIAPAEPAQEVLPPVPQAVASPVKSAIPQSLASPRSGIPTRSPAKQVMEFVSQPKSVPEPPAIETRPPVDDMPEDFFPPGSETPQGLDESKFSISFSDSPLKQENLASDANIIDAMIRILSEGNISEKVDAIVAINEILNQGPNEPQMLELQMKVNLLINAFCVVLEDTFSRQPHEVPVRFAKYFLDVTLKVSQSKLIMRDINEEKMQLLCEQVLTRLLTPDLGAIADNEGEVMKKSLNNIMIKILEHCDSTRIFVVLIRLLCKHSCLQQRISIVELIVKCLLKMTKILDQIIKRLDVSAILVEMHEFLVTVSNTGTGTDVGEKTIKTILNEMVKILGEDIMSSYEAIREHKSPDRHIEIWIKMILNSHTGNSKTKAYSELTEIILQLSNPATFEQALSDMFALTEKYPEVDVYNTPQFKSMDPVLSDQVCQGLMQMKMQDERPATSQENNENQLPGFKIQDYKSKLELMKQKYGISNSSATVSNRLSDLKAKVNSLLAPSAVPSSPSGIPSSSSSSQLKARLEEFKRQ